MDKETLFLSVALYIVVPVIIADRTIDDTTSCYSALSPARALATVVGVLVEVPVMLSVVRIVNGITSR